MINKLNCLFLRHSIEYLYIGRVLHIPYLIIVEGNKTCKKEKRFCFLHLDLGNGGAEQLILNLARASLSVGDDSSNVNAVD